MNSENSKGLQKSWKVKEIKAALARRCFKDFVLTTMPTYEVNWHHDLLMRYLQKFADGEIKKLLIFMPPQHGKSQLTSRHLPAYLLGVNPSLKIVGCSYSSTLASSFNRDVQRLIDSEEYFDIFPNTRLNGSSAKGGYLRNSDLFQVVDNVGFYKSVGMGGSLTGTTAELGIIDDPIKDSKQAESTVYRANDWEWFTNVFLSRLNNKSQVLITQTRWNIDDLSGRILSKLNDDKSWVVLTLPAIKDGPSHPEDPRAEGEALWENKHSLKRLLGMKHANPRMFHALYQQSPQPFKGGLCFPKYYTCTKTEYAQASGRKLYGMDFGFSNPSVLLEIKIDIPNRRLYVKEVFYKSGLTPDLLREELRIVGMSRATEIIADSNRIDVINDLKRFFNIKPAKKGPGSVFYGITKVNDFTIYILEGSNNVLSEMDSYRFIEDKDGNPTNEPLKEHDHAMDSLRYAVIYATSKEGGSLLAYG